MGATGSGAVELTATKTIQDMPNATIPFATGAGMPSGAFAGVGVSQPNPNSTAGTFYRVGGSMVLHNSLTIVTVVFDMFLENRNNEGTCFFRGTGVQSGTLGGS
jgi:hypothetical protein